MQQNRRCCIATVLLIGSLISTEAPCLGQYDFVNVADTNTGAPVGNFLSFGGQPAIGQGGTAFSGVYGGGSGIFMDGGGLLKTVAKVGDAAPSGLFTSFGEPAIHQSTAFLGIFNGGSGIFLGNGGPLTSVAKTGDTAPSGTFTGFGNPALAKLSQFPILVANTTAFQGSYSGGSGIFTGSGGTLTTMAKTGDAAPSGTFTGFGDPALSAVSGPSVPIVAFRGTYSGGAGIFTKSGSTLTKIATTGDLPAALSFSDPSITHGHVAFRINPGLGSTEAIYSFLNGNLMPVAAAGQAAPSGMFTSFGDPAAFQSGLAFEASYGGGQKGIFATKQPFGPPVPIIKTGDSLFGAYVIAVSMGRFGGKSSFHGLGAIGVGDFAFSYSLDNGRQGIGLIFALPEPPTHSMLVLAGASVAFLKVGQRNGRRKCFGNRTDVI
jgi:hypothetical protein